MIWFFKKKKDTQNGVDVNVNTESDVDVEVLFESGNSPENSDTIPSLPEDSEPEVPVQPEKMPEQEPVAPPREPEVPEQTPAPTETPVPERPPSPEVEPQPEVEPEHPVPEQPYQPEAPVEVPSYPEQQPMPDPEVPPSIPEGVPPVYDHVNTTEQENQISVVSLKTKLGEPEIENNAAEKTGWFGRLKKGLSKSSNKISESITSVLTKRKLDDELLEELEEALIVADLGPATASKLTSELARQRFGKDITDEEVKVFLSDGIEGILKPVAKPLEIGTLSTPYVILFSGVNGAGKTTTIGKLSKQLQQQGKKVMLAAGDTFRAAAVEQLQVWGERTGVPVISKEIGADAGALAFEAMERAKAEKVDVLLIDTAGRLQNKSNLMAELEKIVRVIKKHDETAPHNTLLVLDATTGQNAHSQVELFGKAVDISGLVVTKLDGTAKGGVIVSLAEKFGLPVHAIGIGEGVDDLRPFMARDYARSLMGFDEQ